MSLRAVQILMLTTATLCSLTAPLCAHAQSATTMVYDQPIQQLDDALRRVATASGWEIMFSARDVSGRMAPALQGNLTPVQAVTILLAGSGLTASVANGAIIIRGRDTASASLAPDDAGADVVVTGSHIRGAPSSSPVNSITREDMKKAGQTNLGEVIRSVPQNFNGGQNPGVATGAGVTNTNLNAASSLNLRGLGADATLTLLNGHRLPYDSAFAGVDISAIPLAAVDRLEIVADGASALYGSDAVGGVANVILKKDFDGVELTGRIGASTDGGNVDEQVNIVGGTSWAGGGFLLAYDFQHNSAISARQRSYTSALDDDATLYPEQRRHAVIMSGHQAITENLEFSIDALYNKRWSTFFGAPTKGRGYTYNGQRSDNRVETYSIAPSLRLSLGNRWEVGAQFFYGRDNTHYDGKYYPIGATSVVTKGCYCDDAYSAEITTEGPLFSLPGGDVRMAAGAGYRSNGMDYQRATAGVSAGPFSVSRDSYYGYGELYLPLIGADQHIAGIRRLSATAAVRYEKYPGLAEIATPKFGLIYSPIEDVDLKASWGKSFKAPTLYQQYLVQEAYLFPAAALSPNRPAGSTVLYTSGGNTGTAPERARSWTATLALHPRAIEGLKIEASYFNVRYKDRVVQPIATLGGILDNPAYADLLTFAPSSTLQSAIIGGTLVGLRNFTGQTYDPSKVVALIDNRYRNVAVQKIEGVDIYANYRLSLADSQSLTFTGSGTYLKSRQQLAAALPSIDLAGMVFNPPHVRARGGLVWDLPKASLSAFLNYVGPVTDNRPKPARKVGATWSADMIGRISLRGDKRSKGGVDLTLTLLNILNEKPDIIYMTGTTDTPFDSTNYSSTGRYVGLTLMWGW